ALDDLPERAPPDLVRALRELAARHGALVADIEAAMAEHAADDVPRFDLFFDYCHPNLLGHFIVADAVVRAFDSAPFAARLGVADGARERAGDFAARFAADRDALRFNEEDAARINLQQCEAVVNELGTRRDPPSESWLRPREFADAAARQWPP